MLFAVKLHPTTELRNVSHDPDPRGLTMTAPRRRPRTAPAGTVVSYTRVSTDEQVSSGAGLDAQRAAIDGEAARRGWTIVASYTDEGVSGSRSVDQRPGLTYAVETIEAGHASVLIVSKSDRVARSLRTLLDVVDRVERAGGIVVAVDGTIDTSSAAGRFQTQIMGGVAELERALISDRTKAALAVRRAQGAPGTPVDPARRSRRANPRRPRMRCQLRRHRRRADRGGHPHRARRSGVVASHDPIRPQEPGRPTPPSRGVGLTLLDFLAAP